MAAAAQQQPLTVKSGPGSFTGSRSALAYKLGQEIGAGGNGIVYTVSRRPELVAKIQKTALSQHDIDKLDVLVRATTPELLSVAAWPIDALKASSGQVVGFVMPRILDARPLYELYSPRSRIQHFPSADFRFLVHVAANIARLFAAVHKAGFICGDVNHSNILVRQTGTVAAVDCDSFQVGDGSRFPCLVGTELFVPPELMGAALGATQRTAHHDSFGLAVLIFHLLFMGRHPFAGRFLGKGELPIERAIAESRFAYSRDTRRTQMAPPPFTPPMEAVGAAVVDLFERAFDPQAGAVGRPSPEAWIDALDVLKASLIPCQDVTWHHHLPSTRSCPWCAIEGPARIKLFGGIIKITTAGIADLETLWARYLALAEPGPPRPLPKLPARQPRPQAPQQLKKPRRPRVTCERLSKAFFVAFLLYLVLWKQVLDGANQLVQIIGEGAARATAHGVTPTDILVFGVGAVLVATLIIDAGLAGGHWIAARLYGARPRPPMLVARVLRRFAAERAWRAAAKAWTAQSLPPAVSDLKPPITALKQQLDALAAEREARIRACAAPQSDDDQRIRYLAAFRIEDAKLTTIGPARCAVLRSWGIDTAADIDDAKIAEIPGFGKNLTDKLTLWREIKEKAFVPNPVAVVDPLEVQRIDRQLAARRTKLMRELRERIAEVEQRMNGYLEQRTARWAAVETALNARVQARVWQ
jgi:DNA-binding helix-hairpin-helix protein with protein kinase domain